MDVLKLPLSRPDVEVLGQALDVYATTLMCAPLGLGLDLLVAVRALRDQLDHAAGLHDAAQDAAEDPAGNVIAFARA